MGDIPGRPLGRSPDPLPGESLRGFLLRLSYRLRVSPLQIACLTGCTSGRTELRIGYKPLLDLDVVRFALVTKLTASEAEALTLRPWVSRYPPISRSRASAAWPTITDNWLVRPGLRYCPACLAGDGSSIQRQYGGPWKTYWLLPIAFACPRHQRFLQEGVRGSSITGLRKSDGSSSKALGRACCTRRSAGTACLSTPALRPGILFAEPGWTWPRSQTSRYVPANACWMPSSRHLVEPGLAAAADAHVHRLSPRNTAYQAVDKPPGDVLAAAGLLTAAIAILDSPDLPGIVARYVQAFRLSDDPPPWSRAFTRHQSACSQAMREAGERLKGPYRLLPGSRGAKSPVRAGGYRPEHIPALVEQQWYDGHLARFGYRLPTAIRRAAAILLVQRALGCSLGDATSYLGVRFHKPQEPGSLPTSNQAARVAPRARCR